MIKYAFQTHQADENHNNFLCTMLPGQVCYLTSFVGGLNKRLIALDVELAAHKASTAAAQASAPANSVRRHVNLL